MSERAYTVREIDELRRVCNLRWLYGTSYFPPLEKGQSSSSTSSRSWRGSELDEGVEALVRTYMEAGILAQDIVDEDVRKQSERNGLLSSAASSEQLSSMKERAERAERELDEALDRLSKAYSAKARCNDDANYERSLRIAAETRAVELKLQLEKLEDEPYAYEYHRSNGDGTNSPIIETTVRNPSPEWPVVPLYRKKGNTNGN